MTESPHPIAALLNPALTREDFCKRVGVSKSHLSLILQAKRGVSYALAERIELEFAQPAGFASALMKYQREAMETVGAAP